MTTANKSLVLPNQDQKTCKEYGRELINIGVDVIPMHLSQDTNSETKKYTKKPLVSWKQYQEKKVSLETYDEWCNKFNDDVFNGLAIIGGKQIYALDIDKDYDDALLQRLWDLGTASYETERGYHFLTLEPVPSADAIYKDNHVGEFLGAGHIIVIPPSADRIFLTTTIYNSKFPSLVKPREPEVSFVPDFNKLQSFKSSVPNFKTAVFNPQEKWLDGSRNNELFKYSMRVINDYDNFEEYQNQVMKINDDNCEPPLPFDEVRQMVQTNWKKVPEYQETKPKTKTFHPFLSLTDVRSASQIYDDHFINKYESFFEGADVTFRVASAIAILSSAINPTITFNTGQKNTSSIWVMLVGGSSTTFKSTVISDAERMMIDAGMEEVKLPDTFSPARLENSMSERDGRPNIHMHKEYAGFLQLLSQDNSSGLSNLMIRLWDGDEIKKELVGRDNKPKTDEEGNSYREPEVYKASNPHLSSLVGIQTDRFTTAMSQKQLWDGFLLRWLIVPSENPRRKKLSELRALSVDSSARNDLVQQLSIIFQQNRSSSFSQDVDSDALDLLDEYSDYIYDQIDNLPDGDIGKNLFGRYKTQAEKLCLIVSRSRGSNEITVDDVRYAICLNEIFRIKTHKFLVSNAVSTLETNMNKVIKFLDKQDGKSASRTEINRGASGMSRIESQKMSQLGDKLEEMGYVTRTTIKNKEVWTLIDKLEDDSASKYSEDLIKTLFSKGGI
tara:strand:+ start:2762 stop:4942 length:2181 start_codon:yes stop_codon:yes gene_type:complete